ncbi:MAG: GAF domain-containing protein [Chloroflexi bacterium]|nr:MAG: GAF domain-containing protein [Chloroflexota bacterium]MBL1195016.1 GAF domain-containing protein [Chloroflexota bacterium]NOH12305.1 GAF domain-containing protein [Chloroflexota bacterium]
MPDSTKTLQRELHVITEVSKALTSALELSELLKQVMGRIEDLLEPTEFGVVVLWDSLEGRLRPTAACGKRPMDLAALFEMRLLPGESITGKTYSTRKMIFLKSQEVVERESTNLSTSNRDLLTQVLGPESQLSSVIAAPLLVGQNNYGVLLLASLHVESSFSERELQIVRILADLIALAIHRSQLELEMAAAREEEQVDRMRAEALATLSHELRTPLSAIKGYSTALLLEDINWPEDKRLEFLKLVDAETDHLETMITDILDSALIDVGQLALELQPVRLEHLTREVCDEMRRQTESHKIISDFPSSFPIVDVDPRRIKQVMRNIVDNSIKYSPKGGLIVVRGEERKNDIVIGISDQGVGISPEDLIPLFEKYFRVKSPTGAYVAGTGLGLPVARSIVEAHGGRIWAESRVGEGTSLYFSIPCSGLSAELK